MTGTFDSLVVTVARDVAGLKKLPSLLAIMSCVGGLSSFMALPLIGMGREREGGDLGTSRHQAI